MKTCTKCHIEKSLDNFQKAKGYKDGYQTWCKSCKYVNTRKWIEADPERQIRHNQSDDKWYKEKGREYHENYRNENRDKVREVDRRYKQTHKEELKERKRKRRFAYLDTDITLSWLKQLRDSTPNCLLCGVFMEGEPNDPQHGDLDHIIPLAIGGKHIMENVRYICHDCNLRRPKDGSDTILSNTTPGE